MFAITASPTWFAKSDDFKKIGKKIQKQRKTEVDKIKDKIGWSPEVEFWDGLNRTLNWWGFDE